MATWADLDKLAIARPRPDGRVTLVATDDRTSEAIAETPHLSTVIAIGRVVRGRRAVDERHGGRGVVVYQTRNTPPAFLVDAVSAAGGIVFDGKREHVRAQPLALTVQLDSTFCDLATATRRRLGVKSFGAALDVLEAGLRQRPVQPSDSVAYWTAIFELIALAGELVRSDRPGRWVESLEQRLPFALDLGGGTRVFPGQLAQAIVIGGAGSLRSLVTLAAAPLSTKPGRPGRGAVRQPRPMPLLCDRGAVPLDQLSWSPLVDDEADHPSIPVIVWVEDRGDTLHWPTGRGAPTQELRERALRSVDELAVDITPLELPIATLAVVTGDFFAAETLLSPSAMERVRETLGGPHAMLVATPARGHLIAIPAARALADDELMSAFVAAVEREHQRAPERDRISNQVIVYAERPLGRVQSNLFEAREALRELGVDPDAEP